MLYLGHSAYFPDWKGIAISEKLGTFFSSYYSETKVKENTMGIFSRFKDIVNSNINAILDKAEDPEKMLKLMIQEMEDTLIELKSNCAAKLAYGIKLERKLEDSLKTFTRWENRAVLAIGKGREDLAREALVEKRNVQTEIDSLKSQIEENHITIEEAKREISTLEEKLVQAKGKLKILKQKEERARNERMAQDAMSKDVAGHFEQMEEKIDRMNAFNDLEKGRTVAEDKFSELEKDEEIEKELNELKNRMEGK